MIRSGQKLGQKLGQSRLFRRSLIAIYAVGLVLCLLGVVLALSAPALPKRWMAAAIFTVGAATIGWRLWLYRRTFVTGGLPTLRRLLLVFLPRGALALVGLVMGLVGLSWIVIPLALVRDPGFQATFGWAGMALMCGAGLALIAMGSVLAVPLIRALRGGRSPVVEPEAPSDAPPPDVSPA